MALLVTVAAMIAAPPPTPPLELEFADAAARPRPATTYSAAHRRRAHRQIAAARWYLRRHRATRPYRGWLDRTGYCESHGSGGYRANTGNGFYGRYQFTLTSWRAVGGRGYPHLAPPLEQDFRAIKLLYAQGRGAWPVCG